jgi:phosphomannomutase/phosphoglucomutase
MINYEIFRAYDIRGVYGKDLNEELANIIGKAYCSFLGNYSTVGVGRDVRQSSKSLSDAVISGLVDCGCNVIDFGTVPSPLVYFGVRHLNLNGGLMVTASHLPPEWNGFKFCDSNGILFSEGTGLEKIKKIVLDNNFLKLEKGKYKGYKEISKVYLNYILRNINISKKLKIVIDYGNSVTANIVPHILKSIGMEIYNINESLDVKVPNRSSELKDESLQDLRKKVLETNADIGIAYDGDGDRVAFVDDKGNIYNSGNILIPIFAEHILKNNPGGKIVFDITCSSAVYDYVKSLGGEPIVTRVGHTYVANAVIENRALMGGQYSGHLCFIENNCLDDAIYASIKMLEILSSNNMKLSELTKKIPKYPVTGITEIRCDDSNKFSVINKVADLAKSLNFQIITIDGVKIIAESGWVLIRASNTSPIIRINAEGKTIEDAIKMQKIGENLVKEVMKL